MFEILNTINNFLIERNKYKLYTSLHYLSSLQAIKKIGSYTVCWQIGKFDHQHFDCWAEILKSLYLTIAPHKNTWKWHIMHQNKQKAGWSQSLMQIHCRLYKDFLHNSKSDFIHKGSPQPHWKHFLVQPPRDLCLLETSSWVFCLFGERVNHYTTEPPELKHLINILSTSA